MLNSVDILFLFLQKVHCRVGNKEFLVIIAADLSIVSVSTRLYILK